VVCTSDEGAAGDREKASPHRARRLSDLFGIGFLRGPGEAMLAGRKDVPILDCVRSKIEVVASDASRWR
jgi:hypothetical protein